MALPQRPTDFKLEPGKGYLRHIIPRPATPYTGPDAAELDDVADQAWYYVLARLIDRYDIEGWDVNPPIPLKVIWEKLAAGFLLEKWAGVYGSEREEESAPNRLIREAEELLASILSPVDDSITLIDPATGLPIRPKSSSRQVAVWSPEPEWLPERSGRGGGFGMPSPVSAEDVYRRVIEGE